MPYRIGMAYFLPEFSGKKCVQQVAHEAVRRTMRNEAVLRTMKNEARLRRMKRCRSDNIAVESLRLSSISNINTLKIFGILKPFL